MTAHAKALRVVTLNMRATAEEKSFFQKAAELAGFSNLTNFIMTAVRKEANRVLSDTHTSYVSAPDWELVNNLVSHPPRPNKKIKKLMRDV